MKHSFIMLSTIKQRLKWHKDFWENLQNEPEAKIKALLLTVEKAIQDPCFNSAEVQLHLATLDAERMAFEWRTDPDMLRGEKQIQGASKGGREKAKQTGWKY